MSSIIPVILKGRLNPLDFTNLAYRQVRRSKFHGYLLLATIMKKKNIMDNERFRKDVLNIQRKGPSDLQIAVKRAWRRSSEYRKSTSTRDSKRRNSMSEQAGMYTPCPPLCARRIEVNGTSTEQSQRPRPNRSEIVTFKIVDGKPFLQRRSNEIGSSRKD